MRLARPLKTSAVTAADNEFYAAHKDDPRLFDAAGRRIPLSATDPDQEQLRQEWIALYLKKGGETEKPKPKSSKPPKDPKTPCPDKPPPEKKLANLTVEVHYDPLDAPIKDVEVKIDGPMTVWHVTDPSGIVRFTDLPPGDYTISTKYVGKNALVDWALPNDTSTHWAVANPRAPYPAGVNKCNLFTYEMTRGVGEDPPMKSHTKLWGLGSTVYLPPLAGDWADSSTTVGKWKVVSTPEPGDVIAWSHNYSDASGHCGILTYPQPQPDTTQHLDEGDDKTAKVKMLRSTISAHEDDVENDTETFWHYYREGNSDETSKIIFRRYSP